MRRQKFRPRFEKLETRLTPSGVERVMDINRVGTWFGSSAELNGSLFYNHLDADAGLELFVSDGTPGGTHLFKDICPGPQNSRIDQLVNINDTLYFVADDGVHGLELWKSDGTAAGTVMVQDLTPGPDDTGFVGPYSAPSVIEYSYQAPVGAGGRVFVQTYDYATGISSLYSTDGSTIALVQSDYGVKVGMIAYASELYYGYDEPFDGNSDIHLFKSDGFTTTLVSNAMGDIWDPAVLNGSLFFYGADAGRVNYELWAFDPTNGARQLGEINPSGGGVWWGYHFVPVEANGTVYFQGDGGNSNLELYRYTGTGAPTLVQDLTPNYTSYGGSLPQNLTVVTNGGVDTLYFQAIVTDTNEPPVLGGSLIRLNAAGDQAEVLGDGIVHFGYPYYYFQPGFNAWPMCDLNGVLVFSGCDTTNLDAEPWAYDGSDFAKLGDINPGSESSLPFTFTVIGDQAYFFAFQGPPGYDSLWVTDGTTMGTGFLAEARTYSEPSHPDNFTDYMGTTFFTADDGTIGAATLWTTDGTAAGTMLFPPATALYSIDELTVVRGSLWFVATDTPNGRELWSYDPTNGLVLHDIRPGSASSVPYGLTSVPNTEYGDALYFIASHGSFDTEVTVLDDRGVTNLDIWPGMAGGGGGLGLTGFPSSPASGIFGGNGFIAFASTDGTNGTELYLTDGATLLTYDLNPGDDDYGGADGYPDSSSPYYFTMLGDQLCFSASNGNNLAAGEVGTELAVLDLLTGSVTFVDVNTNTGGMWADSSIPRDLTIANNLLWFWGDDDVGHEHLYVWDGSMVTEVMLPATYPDVRNLTKFGNALVFDAVDSVEGRNLWMATDATHFTMIDPGMTPQPWDAPQFAYLTDVNGSLFFWATTSVGTGMWTYDGVANPEFLFACPAEYTYLNAGAANFHAVAGSETVVFTANDAYAGLELFAFTQGQAPTADAGGPYSVAESQFLFLDASLSTDPDGSIVSYTWDLNEDGIFGDAVGVTPILSWTALQGLGINDGPATWNVVVRVTDNDGTVSESTPVTLSVINTSPTAGLINNGPVAEGSPVTITFRSLFEPSNADATAGLLFSYDFDNDGTFDVVDSTSFNASHAYPDNGTYTVKGRIRDKDGGFNEYTTTVTVTNVAPTATLTNTGPIDEAGAVTVAFSNQLDPSSVDVAAGFLYSFDLNNDGDFSDLGDQFQVSTPNVVIGFLDSGVFTIRARIEDKDGGFSDKTTTITVNNVPPVATFSDFGSVIEGRASTVGFSSPSDPSAVDATSLLYSFDFNNDGDFIDSGDVVNSTNPAASHVFPNNGTYTVHGRVSDKDGGFTDYTTTITVTNVDVVVTAFDKGGEPRIRVLDAETRTEAANFLAYDLSYRGGVRVAVGDVTGDGIPDIIAAPGAKGVLALGTRDVRVFDGITFQPLTGFFAGVRPFGDAFKKGINVAAGDVNGDGFCDIIVSPSKGFTPQVKIYSGADGGTLYDFPAFTSATPYLTGVRVAAGDVNGDGFTDIIVQAGAGVSSRIRVYDGVTGVALGGVFASLNPFGDKPAVHSGVFIAAGDVTGDGKADIIAAVSKGTPLLRVFDGVTGLMVAETTSADLAGYKGGIRVGLTDANGDGELDILTGSGKAKGLFGHVRVLDGDTLTELDQFFADPTNAFKGGVYVGGGR